MVHSLKTPLPLIIPHIFLKIPKSINTFHNIIETKVFDIFSPNCSIIFENLTLLKKTASFIRYIDNLENIPFISSAISTFTYTVKVLDNFENKQQVRMK